MTLYLQLCYYNLSLALGFASVEEKTESTRLILIVLQEHPYAVQTNQGVTVPWKIDHLIKVPGVEEELLSLSLTRHLELDCYVFTLKENLEAKVKRHYLLGIPAG